MEESVFISRDLQKVCRICLLERNSMKHIHDKLIKQETALTIIQKCTTFEIEDRQEFPNHICDKCEAQLVDIHKFKLKYEKSRIFLYEYHKIISHENANENGTCNSNTNNESNGQEEKMGEDVDIYADLDFDVQQNNERADETNEKNVETNGSKKRDEFKLVTVNKMVQTKYFNVSKYIEEGSSKTDKNENNDELQTQNEKNQTKCNDVPGESEEKRRGNVENQTDIDAEKADGAMEMNNKDEIVVNQKSKDKSKKQKKETIDAPITNDDAANSLGMEKKHSKSIRIEKDGKVLFICKVCGQEFDGVYKLADHRQNFNHFSKKTVTCTLCNKIVVIQHYKRHLSTHKKEYNCPICSKKFYNKYNLNRHKLVHEAKVQHCAVAELLGLCKSFKQKEKKYSCAICNKSYTTDVALSVHKIVHTEKRLICEICRATFPSEYKLATHMAVHQEKMYLCSKCGKRCSSYTTLKLHLAIHAGVKPYKCKECDQSFSQAGFLKDHMLIHRQLRPYVCKICSKSFNRISNLKRHTLIHTDNRQFACEYCEKRFTVKYALVVHRRLHTGETPYVCPICGKEFTDSGGRSRHLKSHDLCALELPV